MNHFILTRFNLRLWPRDKHNQETQTEEWLGQRFSLFERYCLPSVKKQCCQDFHWIILMDKQTPEIYRERMHRDIEGMENVNVIGVRPQAGWAFQRIFSEVVEANRDKGEKRVVTTYLDNDDALKLDYVEKIQAEAAETADKTFIAYAYGLQYYTELNIAVRVRWPNNHFLSYVEDVKKGSLPLTVHGYGGHMHIYKLRENGVSVKTIDDTKDCGWLEIVHEKNVDNDVKMRLDVHRVANSNALLDYGISKNIDGSLSAYLTKFGIRAIRHFFIRLRRKILGKKMGEH